MHRKQRSRTEIYTLGLLGLLELIIRDMLALFFGFCLS